MFAYLRVLISSPITASLCTLKSFISPWVSTKLWSAASLSTQKENWLDQSVKNSTTDTVQIAGQKCQLGILLDSLNMETSQREKTKGERLKNLWQWFWQFRNSLQSDKHITVCTLKRDHFVLKDFVNEFGKTHFHFAKYNIYQTDNLCIYTNISRQYDITHSTWDTIYQKKGIYLYNVQSYPLTTLFFTTILPIRFSNRSIIFLTFSFLFPHFVLVLFSYFN